jgi:hypothetical protein
MTDGEMTQVFRDTDRGARLRIEGNKMIIELSFSDQVAAEEMIRNLLAADQRVDPVSIELSNPDLNRTAQ